MIKLFGAISRKTCFTFAVVCFTYPTVLIGAAMGLFFEYISLGIESLTVYLLVFKQTVILAVAGGAIHFLLVGIIPGIQMNRIKPLNKCIDGYDVKSVTLAELKAAIDILKKFPILNTLIAGGLTFLVILSLTLTVYLKTHQPMLYMGAFMSGSIAMALYSMTTFILGSAICDRLRRQMLQTYHSFHKQQKDKK